MIDLSGIFHRHAPDEAFIIEEAEQTGTTTGTATGAGKSNGADVNSLVLEFRDNPFASFMRRLREMIDTDPKEALRMVQNAKQAKIFTKAHEKALLDESGRKVAEALHNEKPQGLAHSFLRSALDIALGEAGPNAPRDPQILAPHLRPNFQSPALTPTPFPAFA